MSSGIRTGRLALAVLFIFVLHAAFAGLLVIYRVHPNAALTALLISCLFVDAATGAWLGLMIGLLEGSWLASYSGSFMVTRTIAGWAVGALEYRIFRDNPLVAMGVAVVGTLLVECCFFLFAPQPHILRWFFRTIWQSVYNGLLGLPIYYFLRRAAFARR